MATSAAVCNSAYQVLISEAAPQHMKNRKNTSEAQLRQPREPWVEAAALLHPMHHLASHGMKFWSQLVAWHATVHGFLGQVAEAVEELLPRRHGSKPLRLGPQHTRTLGMHAHSRMHRAIECKTRWAQTCTTAVLFFMRFLRFPTATGPTCPTHWTSPPGPSK